jgi:metallo-beta-lactamase family protein
MKLTFFGAAQTVTGSKYVLETENFKVLLDCGLYQGRRETANALNKKLPFEAREINAVILSHAHTDHSGMLPVLVKEGFSGKIYCSAPTADITKFILEDAANIQQEDALHYNKHLPSGQIPIEPIYTQQDVKKTFSYFQPTAYFRLTNTWTQISENIRFKFYDAGHILGSVVTLLEITEKGVAKNLVFTGDLGRSFLPILRDPEYVKESAETVIMECTYGDKLHRPVSDLAGDLKKIINEAVKNNSKIVVPAFSLGRTQELIYMLHKLVNDKQIPVFPIFIDSPLAKNITRVFQTYTSDFDEEFWKDFGENGDTPFLMKNLITISSIEESKSINDKVGPYMVIAGSGMCEGGRILHHLKNTIEDSNAIILITGYQAQNTLGRKIQEGLSPVKIFGQEYAPKARVITLDELSAHADQKDLLRYASSIKGLKNLFLVHTELSKASAFKTLLQQELPLTFVSIPSFGESFEL